MIRKIVVTVAVLAAIQAAAVGIYYAVQRPRAKEPAGFRVEKLRGDARAPNLLLERADGRRLSINDVGSGVRLVHFWATWCPPCVDELPGLLATSRELAGSGLTLVAISMDDDWAAIRSFFDGEVPVEVYRAVDPDANAQYDVVSLPDTYLVSPGGRMRFRYGGARNWRSRDAIEHLAAQLR